MVIVYRTPPALPGVVAFVGLRLYNPTMGLTNRVDRISELIEEVLKREEEYQVFLDASPWGILVVDQTFHIVYMNSTLERMSGYRLSEIVGEHLRILLPAEDHKAHAKREAEYVKHPVSRTGNHGLKPRLLKKDGSILAVEVSISPTSVHGRRLFFASIRPLETLFDTVDGVEKQPG